tara:strand:+ start:255 stop:425 length:171 start_codon:yes stop_codon:yes gene_type:complete
MGVKFNLYMQKLLKGEIIDSKLENEAMKERQEERERLAEEKRNIQRVDAQTKGVKW